MKKSSISKPNDMERYPEKFYVARRCRMTGLSKALVANSRSRQFGLQQPRNLAWLRSRRVKKTQFFIDGRRLDHIDIGDHGIGKGCEEMPTSQAVNPETGEGCRIG